MPNKIVLQEREFIQLLLVGWSTLAVATFALLFKVAAPYGKFRAENAWLMRMNGKLGWFVQEIVSPLTLIYFFFNPLEFNLFDRVEIVGAVDVPWFRVTWQYLFLALWIGHYIHRSVIYTLLCPSMADTDVLVVSMAIGFNLVNGYLNGSYLGRFAELQNNEFDSVALFGIFLFAVGYFVNLKSDYHLLSLRKAKRKPNSVEKRNLRSNSKSETEGAKHRYFIPTAGFFKYVSCANYFGELLEWTGFALCLRSGAAWSFVLWTFANLAPRAVKTHQWYLKTFSDKYPKDRKAIIPYLL